MGERLQAPGSPFGEIDTLGESVKSLAEAPQLSDPVLVGVGAPVSRHPEPHTLLGIGCRLSTYRAVDLPSGSGRSDTRPRLPIHAQRQREGGELGLAKSVHHGRLGYEVEAMKCPINHFEGTPDAGSPKPTRIG